MISLIIAFSNNLYGRDAVSYLLLGTERLVSRICDISLSWPKFSSGR